MTAVTLVAHDIGPVGGMERQLTELIIGLRAADTEVTVIARRCELPVGVEVHFVRVPGPARPFAVAYPWFAVVGTLLTAIRRRGVVQATGAIVLNRVDVLSVHLSHHAFADTGLLRVGRRSAFHLLNARAAGWLSRLGERVCFPRARTLAAVSPGVAREIEASFPHLRNRIAVVPNGVDVHRFTPGTRPAGTRRALFVGSEWEGKGLALAIEALAHAPDWQLDVVGDGDADHYRAVAQRHGVEDRVRFAGRRHDPEAFYQAATAFVLPSVYETFSLVTYEAAASGLPLLVTRVSGVEDLLEDGVSGWFVDRDPKHIGALLQQLDDTRIQTMGAAARRAALRFDWNASVDAHLEVYATQAAGR